MLLKSLMTGRGRRGKVVEYLAQSLQRVVNVRRLVESPALDAAEIGYRDRRLAQECFLTA